MANGRAKRPRVGPVVLMLVSFSWLVAVIAPEPQFEDNGMVPETKSPVRGLVSDCKCTFEGRVLPESVYKGSAHARNPAIAMYGTTCAAWDAMPGTPWKEHCPDDKDFCHEDNNWCQTPWCYVDDDCASGYETDVFAPQKFKYSYEACSSDFVQVPMCYATDKPATDGTIGKAVANYASGVCPFDPRKEGDCMLHQRDACACINHGAALGEHIYRDTDYKDLKHIAWYGTSCTAWDRIPDTPWWQKCPSGTDFCMRDKNWCVLHWCYVDQACPTAKKTDVFAPKEFYYSYETCGGPNCYEKTTQDELFGGQKVCPAWADCPNGETTKLPALPTPPISCSVCVPLSPASRAIVSLLRVVPVALLVFM